MGKLKKPEKIAKIRGIDPKSELWLTTRSCAVRVGMTMAEYATIAFTNQNNAVTTDTKPKCRCHQLGKFWSIESCPDCGRVLSD